MIHPEPKPRAVVIHEIADGRSALAAAAELAVPVLLVSAPSGAAALGAGWWQALVRQLSAEYPDMAVTAILDCGCRADLVQAALRQGLGDLGYRGPPSVASKLQDIAGQRGARLHRRLPQALDLTGVLDRDAACRAWLSKKRRGRPAG
ncbi:MAG: hypothetical protein ACREH3_02925 [Geminicoccales bacterium]